MTKDEVAARLRALAADDKKRSETARLREVIADVEATLKAGVSQADVLAELHKEGFTMTMASFKSALQRIRKERAGDKPARQSPAPAAAPSPNLRHDEDPPASVPAPEPADPTPADDPPPAGLTRKQASELKADQYLSPNALLKRLAGKEKK